MSSEQDGHNWMPFYRYFHRGEQKSEPSETNVR